MLVLAIAAGLALTWDVLLASRLAQLRTTPRILAALGGLGALLAAPALLIAIAIPSELTGRSVAGVAWIWPLTVAIFAAESLYATVRRLASPLVGVPVTLYNVLLLIVAVTRYLEEGGATPPSWALTLVAAYTTALGAASGPVALASPYAVLVPLAAPALPGRWRVSAAGRAVLALAAGLTVAGVLAWLPAAASAVRSYDRYASDPLQERPAGDFAVGVRLLPPIEAPPPPAALRNDLALVDTTGAELVSLVVDPSGAHAAALDSIARVFDPLRRDSTLLVVTLGYPREAARRRRASASAYEAERLADLQRIVRRLHPDYLLPADEPYGRGARALGSLPVGTWIRYLTDAARTVRAIDPHVKVGIAAAAFDSRDSALYAWAAAPGSPIDAVGFSLYPAFAGAVTLDARMRAADRWMRRLAP